jgi:hypothetical protein
MDRLTAVALALIGCVLAGCSSGAAPTPTTASAAAPATAGSPATSTLAGDASAADSELVARFVEYAKNPTPEAHAALPLADKVQLALSSTVVSTVNGSALKSPADWSMYVDQYQGQPGPFSALAYLTLVEARTVTAGPHPHCDAPARPTPAGLEKARQVSVQPGQNSGQSCESWFTVDFFVSDAGQVEAISVDF